MSSVRSHIFRFILRKSAFNMNKPLAELRSKLEGQAKLAKIPKDIKISPIVENSIKGEWITPNGADKDKVILYIHGGGFCMGSCITHRPLLSNIAHVSRITGLLLDYRLAPENPFPAALEDSIAAYKWLLGKGYLPRNIIIAGDSVGGGLTLATLLSLRDDNVPLPAAGICISPLTDQTWRGESMKSKADIDPCMNLQDLIKISKFYLGDSDPSFPLVSPLYGDLSSLPPLLIHVGTDEVLLDDSIRFADKAKIAGVDVTLKIWNDMWHVFHALAQLMPEAKSAIEDIGLYINNKIGKLSR